MLGYHIRKETQILVNVWAIGRDPKIWETPLESRPERFLEPNIVDYKGHHFEFIPFGSGRRTCPAIPLVSRVLTMALEMDMSEQMGTTLKKAIPLKATATPHKG
ncbi:hypothetical protein RHMOL_Rhmol07G0243900 [Rhododendron molle]|uniref:Uncharacterized protein n=1 Tax=Rhododendron molle TaxID=49168 RepID=A0ACC0N4G9_RHOML|nr:hypothetical protein RHMOL_Rhmol07G0243900 [Rhododendron molle]